MLKRNRRDNWLTCHGSRTGYFRSGLLKRAWEMAVMLYMCAPLWLHYILHIEIKVFWQWAKRNYMRMKQARIPTYLSWYGSDVLFWFCFFLSSRDKRVNRQRQRWEAQMTARSPLFRARKPAKLASSYCPTSGFETHRGWRRWRSSPVASTILTKEQRVMDRSRGYCCPEAAIASGQAL